MALALYSEQYWYPTGALAQNLAYQVFPNNSNAFAQLWADPAGTIPLANPGTSTDGAGFVTFYATVGQYWLHLDTETFLIDVGLSEEQADLSTGIASGGDMKISGGNPQAVEITALVGYIVDNNDPLSVSPSIVKVDRPTQTVMLDGAALARALTWWLMDSAGAVIQQAFPPTPSQRRDFLQLGISLYDPFVGMLVDVQSNPVILGQPANQFVDLLDSLGPFNLGGNIASPVAGTLQFDLTAGSVFSRALNYYDSGVLTNSPHINATPAHSPTTFKRVIRVAESPLPPDVTIIDPTQWDLNGVLTPVVGPAAVSTVQRIFVVPNSSPSAQVVVQYGQHIYASLLAAVNSIGASDFEPNPAAGFGALVGYIALIRTCTDLSDQTQAVFVGPTSKLPTQ
jgi:hypothetical protein